MFSRGWLVLGQQLGHVVRIRVTEIWHFGILHAKLSHFLEIPSSPRVERQTSFPDRGIASGQPDDVSSLNQFSHIIPHGYVDAACFISDFARPDLVPILGFGHSPDLQDNEEKVEIF